MNFERIVYCFNSETHLLFEVRFRDKEITDKSQLYKWFIYDSVNDNLISLDFVSMSDNKREFKQGRLTFNDQNAIFFTEKDQGINFDSMRFHNLFNLDKNFSDTFINVLARSILAKYNK